MTTDTSIVARELEADDVTSEPLNLTLEQGLVCLIGPEQGRLTDYMQLLAGITQNVSGELRLLGRPSRGPGARDWQLLRRRVGFVTPQAPLLSIMNGLRNVMLPALYHQVATEREVEQQAWNLIDEFEHTANYTVLPGYMTELQRRLLLIARALILEPRILLLDRPFAGLDAAAQVLLRKYIEGAVRRRVPLLLVAANDRLLAQQADAVLFIGSGGVRLFSGWGAVVDADAPEVQAYLQLEWQLCTVLE